MPITGATCYSDEQLLRGLRFAVEPFNHNKIPIEAATPLCAIVDEEDVWLLDVELRRCFAINLSREDWTTLILHGAVSDEWLEEIWPTLTFGTIADFLRRVATPAPFDSMTFLGRGGEAAGAFCGIQQIIAELGLDPEAIAPSTPIRSYLRGPALLQFWKRMRILVGDDIPPITDKSSQTERITGPLTLLCVPVIMIATVLLAMQIVPVVGALWRPLEVVVFLSVLAMIIWRTLTLQSLLNRLVEFFSDPIQLPSGIRTFRDLSVRIASRHNSVSTMSAA
ncbi:MAG: hypothetical protein K8T25_12600 [Planctomycetia bacterium]|nr:hypothetical protein [Planctomycetia bacterium]